MKFTKILSLVLAMLMLSFAFVGCTGSNNNENETESDVENNEAVESGDAADTSYLLEDGVLTVAMEIGYPPFENYATDGETPIGFDVDLAAAIAEYLGVEVKYMDTAWDGIFDGLKIDKYDCVMSAVTISAERAENMDFSTPYTFNYQSLVINKDSDVKVSSPADLTGLKVGYQGATASDEYLGKLIATGEVDCEVNEYDKVIDAFTDLKNKRLDVIICDSTVTADYLVSEPETYELVWTLMEEPEEFGVAVKKGNEALLSKINEALAALEESGKLDEIRSDWGLMAVESDTAAE